MKYIIRLISLLGAAATLDSWATVVENTNTVAVAILAYASMDNDDDLDADAEYPVRYTDWNGLLDAVSFPGLTRQDKDAMLFDYMMNQSTNDLSSVDGEIRELIRIGLCECRDLNHTNSLPYVRNFLLNQTAHYMDEPVYLYYKWASLNDDYLAVTRSFLSNESTAARASKPSDLLYLINSIDRHEKYFGKNEWYTNVVNLVYQSRASCAECAVVLDRLYVSKFCNYEQSSNRLETVRGWLGSTNCTSEVRAHCISITNQLMNASQPLQEVEALRGL